ncbi:helix-turn-helix transcriptional regulator [Nocardia sp. CNY236]|uniref:helix-turn-helix domain-containing protein n=1 Tax=Nocardia sp. CNY236 TaxID=1169152 RepID=UPI00048D523B|nr:helix-turn-helix transcriptional regulator [Nocardia sp. CNY236]
MDGHFIRSARQARGWSQTQLLAALRSQAVLEHVTLMSPASLRVALSRWENGHTAPDLVHTRLLCSVLELSPVDSTGPVAGRGEPSDDSLFAVLAHHTNSLRLLDRRLGAPFVRAQTAGHVSALELLWERRSGVDRRSVALVQADTAALAAWEDLDVGDHTAADRHFGLARQAASRSGDPTLLAHALGEHAVMLSETGPARRALAQVRRAETLPGLPMLLRAWLAATRAQVATWCPGESMTVRKAMTEAETALTHARPGDEVALPFLALNEIHLQRWNGHVLVRLGDPAGGPITEQALAGLPAEFVRARAGQVLDLAEYATRHGDLDLAMARLVTAAQAITTVGSRRLRYRHDLIARRVRELTAGCR